MRHVPAPLLLCALLGCSGGGGSPSGGSVTLSNGITVLVDDTGAFELRDGERVLLASAPGHALTTRSFDESFSGALAIYEFERDNVVETVHGDFRGIEGDATGASVNFASARLRLEPGARPEQTELTWESLEGAHDAIAMPVRCDAPGSFHGFGEQYHSTDQRGEAFSLIVSEQGIGRVGGVLRAVSGDSHTSYFPMPWYIDRRGFGVLLRTDYRVEVDVCAGDAEVAWLEVVGPEPLRGVVFHGPRPLDVINQLGAELGVPKRPPDWAFSPWLAAQGGTEVVRQKVQAMRDAQIPVAAIWSQDWTGPRQNFDGGYGVQYRWNDDSAHYPQLREFIDELHADGLRFLGYANPFVDPALADHFPAMAAAGQLLKDGDGEAYVFPAPNVESAHPDFTQSATDAVVRAELREMVEDFGMDGWMADFAEWTPLDAVTSDGTPGAAYHNRFPVDWHRVNREAMDAARPDGDWVTIARSGWTGVQRYSTIHWVGDQEADFEETDGLPTVVPAMVNLGLAGIPYVTHDIAGFSGGPSTKELYQRWTELGAFTPVMRTHEGNNRAENWQWDSDEETTAHFRRFARIHEALAPELRSLADAAQNGEGPMVRHLMLVFPDDAESYAIHDQYMLGDSLLVAPVVHAGDTQRELYLPPGEWFHVFTGEAHSGGQRVTVDAPIGTPPVFSLDVDRAELRAID